jgi:hypothetical protein
MSLFARKETDKQVLTYLQIESAHIQSRRAITLIWRVDHQVLLS